MSARRVPALFGHATSEADFRRLEGLMREHRRELMGTIGSCLLSVAGEELVVVGLSERTAKALLKLADKDREAIVEALAVAYHKGGVELPPCVGLSGNRPGGEVVH